MVNSASYQGEGYGFEPNLTNIQKYRKLIKNKKSVFGYAEIFVFTLYELICDDLQSRCLFQFRCVW